MKYLHLWHPESYFFYTCQIIH